MAVKIRLARRGRKKLAMYDVVVTDSRSPRDGVFIEKIGTYKPGTNPATIEIADDKALNWLMKGAQPSDTVRAMLSYRGIMIRKHLQVGVTKGAITQEEADMRFEKWKTAKEAKINAKIQTLSTKKEAALKSRQEAEAKIKDDRAAALRAKQEAMAKEAKAQAEAAAAAQTTEVQAEAPVAEPQAAAAAQATEVQAEAPVAEPQAAAEPAAPQDSPVVAATTEENPSDTTA